MNISLLCSLWLHNLEGSVTIHRSPCRHKDELNEFMDYVENRKTIAPDTEGMCEYCAVRDGIAPDVL